MTTFTFENLWKNHPVIASDGKPCIGGGFNNGNTFSNQCAINMGVAFQTCGVEAKKWGIDRCSLSKSDEEHRNHTIRAENFARALNRVQVNGVGSLQKIVSEDFDLRLTGKTGIIFFKDYWRRERGKGKEETFANRSGDHIDLWNGSRTTTAGWFRLNLFNSIPGWYSDLEDSREIWFWAVA